MQDAGGDQRRPGDARTLVLNIDHDQHLTVREGREAKSECGNVAAEFAC